MQGMAMKDNKIGPHQCILKFAFGWCATQNIMRIWGKRVTSACPRCDIPVKDNSHLFLCQAE